VVQPGSKLEAGFQLKTVRKSRSKLVAEKKDPLAMMKALSQQAAAAKAKASGAAQRDIYKYASTASPAHAALLHGRACSQRLFPCALYLAYKTSELSDLPVGRVIFGEHLCWVCWVWNRHFWS
jgi:hypothetical protein